MINGVTTLFVGGHYEVSGGAALAPPARAGVTKYYFAESQRVATPALHIAQRGASVKRYTIPQPMTVNYFLSDQLGSTSVVTDAAGAKVSGMRYKAWGELRYAWKGAPAGASPSYLLPEYSFTGQYGYVDDPSTPATEGFGLMYYRARWLDPLTDHFA